MAINYSKSKYKNTKFDGTGGITIPIGTTAERPSGETGLTRFNTESGSIEFYDGASWISTNLIPSISTFEGNITTGLSTTIVIGVVNATETIDVIYTEGGIEIGRNEGVLVSNGEVTVTVPAEVYNQSAGDLVTISVANTDGTPSSNSVNRTIGNAPSGGTISTFNGYRIHAFTGNGTFTWPTNLDKQVDVMLVGGGGAGSGDNGAGGGAGGLVYKSNYNISATSYSITIGQGGTVVNADTNPNISNNGTNTTGFGYTALGGGAGGGGNTGTPGRDGGSGGGEDGEQKDGRGSGLQPGTNPGVDLDLGNDGGVASSLGDGPGAGGGGAGAVGGTPGASNKNQAGNGGAGYDMSSIFGTAYGENGYFAGGGAGGVGNNGGAPPSEWGNGGIGGGGDHYKNGATAYGGNPGLPNTGGGGGAGAYVGPPQEDGGPGGSGIVLIRYPL